MIGACRIFVKRSKGKILLGRPRHRWEDNIKLIFQKGDGEAWAGLIWLKIGAGS